MFVYSQKKNEKKMSPQHFDRVKKGPRLVDSLKLCQDRPQISNNILIVKKIKFYNFTADEDITKYKNPRYGKGMPLIRKLPLIKEKKKMPKIITRSPEFVRRPMEVKVTDSLQLPKTSSCQLKIIRGKADNKGKVQNNNLRVFKYLVKKGNNRKLVKAVLSQRVNWREVMGTYSTEYNLKWSCNRRKCEFGLLDAKNSLRKMINHFEFETEISNKKFMFVNFFTYCDSQGINPFEYVPFTVMLKINSDDFANNFNNFTKIFTHVDEYASKGLKINYTQEFKSDLTDYKCVADHSIIPQSHFKGRNLWLVKPPNLSWGDGIQITTNLEEIKSSCKKLMEGVEKGSKKKRVRKEETSSEEDSDSDACSSGPKYRTSTVVLQKYIEDPLLYNGRKFDIRIWVLIDQHMDVHLFREGHLKVTSAEYTIDKVSKFVHLTNYSLQKHSQNFQKFEEGNEVSFADFQRFLDAYCKDKPVNVYKDLVPQMCEIIRLSTMSVCHKINKKDRKYCYIVLGYDFMVDVNFKVWLIEINRNPGLTESSSLIKRLVPRMLDDTFRLTIDKVFQPKYAAPNDADKYKSTFPVEGYSDYENIYLFLHSLK